MRINLTNVRLSFPNLAKPKAFSASTEAKYSASFLLDKVTDKGQIDNLRVAVGQLIAERLPPNSKIAADKICVKDSVTFPKETPGYENVVYLSASNAEQPGTVDRYNHLLDPRKLYGGCYVNAAIDLWAQNNDFGKRINASLVGVQFVKDGEAFSGAAPFDASSTFTPLEASPDGGSPNPPWDDPNDAPGMSGPVDVLPF